MKTDKQVIFLCGARDFHAMDWYRSSLKVIREPRPSILTDLIGGEGFKILINKEDLVFKLIIIDKILFSNQSSTGDLWRNIIKAILFPFQVLMIRIFSRRHPSAIYYAHSMYYIWLAWASGLQFIGVPQGSDILLKPHRSKIFKILATYSMRSAVFITVDSKKMADGVECLIGSKPLIMQNGIDINVIRKVLDNLECSKVNRNKIVSMRGFTNLYRIQEIIKARNSSKNYFDLPINFIYPFKDDLYKEMISRDFNNNDLLLGRLSKDKMYEFFCSSLLVISIPSSDSSPRSVYEAIFCGAIVAITKEQYYFDLPESMKSRIILVELSDSDWFEKAIELSKILIKSNFMPCTLAISKFDQELSFESLHQYALQKIKY